MKFLAVLFVTFSLVSMTRSEEVAITFDDLPLNGELAPGMSRVRMVRDVVAILKQRAVPSVVGFINAQKIEGSSDGAEALKLWVSSGQHLGNHTYSHVDLNKSTPELFLSSVRADEPVLELLDGSDSWHWFRYPYLREGDTLEKRRSVRTQLHERRYRVAQVTLDFEDYLWNSAYARCAEKADTKGIAWLRKSYLDTAQRYIAGDREMATLVYGRDIKHVLLLHLGAFSTTILPDLLDLLSSEGFTLVTLDQAQSDPAYNSDPDAASTYGGTLLEQWMDVRKLPYPKLQKKPYKELASICTGQ